MRFYRAKPGASGSCERLEVEKAGQVPSLLQKGYVPSVTTILGLIRQGFVEEWLIRQSLEFYEESGDFKAALAYRNTEAADFGTTCHALLEARLRGEPCSLPHDHRHTRACEPLWEWMEQDVEDVLFCEEPFGDSERGYGGTADLLVVMRDGRQMLLDLKTKKHSSNYPLGPDMSCRYQLSAYRAHFQKLYGPMGIGNIFLASPFGYLPQPRLLFVDYGEDDWTPSFEAAHRLWWEQNAGVSGSPRTNGRQTPRARSGVS